MQIKIVYLYGCTCMWNFEKLKGDGLQDYFLVVYWFFICEMD